MNQPYEVTAADLSFRLTPGRLVVAVVTLAEMVWVFGGWAAGWVDAQPCPRFALVGFSLMGLMLVGLPIILNVPCAAWLRLAKRLGI